MLARLAEVEVGLAPTRFPASGVVQRLIETLPAFQHDLNRLANMLKMDADKDGNGGDDAADTTRHFVTTKTRKRAQRKLRSF
jgi:hypothetical protein